ncbi:Rrf2 family transcriptional regulator [Pimelobacter simplex]|uniref:Putative transcriptional regulator of 4-carboxymuconolactone decarboxylase, Rrf2 family n=1 Tax=Nocardioides simplex TaxID=2045 RepID=A0A0A1DGF2_NOCSI|nr:Rrf2 family transcriptional regulator [Pimelobacter simplex]AIY16401.1 putative transcriptional regulator of 4-carboxymuconolactone decarboxylase, Rrf2 family [Pimelobacter simplex]MCG8152931.1 Rrf2 family transcriptional regulator [Pimelobacter simplex]GEB11899.1 transcriptional regulator [Pimelobacter simplex]SFN03170.1 transcriptional regulator, BadM/Rrf2 family [Pimelobacter simplex]
MKLSGGVEWALHCCVVLSRASAPVPSARLAELHGVSKTYLAKHLQALARAGLVRAAEGRDGGYALTREPAAITVLDVVEAIDGDQPAFRCTEIRQQGELALPPEECRVPCGIARVMAEAERSWRRSLAGTTIADLGASLDPARLDRVLGRG